jgi:hypothetical protein
MKKLTILSGIAMVTGLIAFLPKVSAQAITLDQADLPSIGLSVVIDSDGTTKPSPGVAQIATAQNWDFSGLLKQHSKTDVFSAIPSKYTSTFSAASNLCDSTIGGNGYNFFNTSASNFTVVGAEEIEVALSTSLQIELVLNPTFEQSALPATTTSNNINAGKAYGVDIINQSVSIFSKIKFTATIQYKDTVDAWGTMKMPNGHTYQVLRQRHYEQDVDSVFGYAFSTWTNVENVTSYKNQYDWYAKGVGFILAEEDMSPAWDTIVDIMWDTTAPLPTSIPQISIKKSVNVYPNPANSRITFNTSSVSSDQYITICDITGRLVERVLVLNGINTINTGSYANGVYLYSLTDSSGDLIDRGKFIVQH